MIFVASPLSQYLSNYYENKAREPDFKDYDRISAFLQKHPDPYRE